MGSESVERFLTAIRTDLEEIRTWSQNARNFGDDSPFSCKSPSRELHPGPPFNQIAISSLASGFWEGKNQNHSWFSSLTFELIGSKPAYDSPRLKSISGSALPLTANSGWVSQNLRMELSEFTFRFLVQEQRSRVGFWSISRIDRRNVSFNLLRSPLMWIPQSGYCNCRSN